MKHVQKLSRRTRNRNGAGPAPMSTFFGGGMLMPFLLQLEGFLTWLLLAVIGGIVLIYILITFILRPLSRRDAEPAAPPAEPEPAAPAGEKPEPVTALDDAAVSDQAAADTVVDQPAPTAPFDPAATQPSPTFPAVGQPLTAPESGQRPEGIGWQIAGLTDVGLKRELNEDNLLLIEGEIDGAGPYGLYVVADGLGGHEAGEIASQITVDAVKQHVDENPPANAAPPFEEWFKSAILKANDEVLNYQESHAEAQKMGSTLVMALVLGQKAYVTNVGDSRAYKLTANTIEQISTDHSLVERLVQIGQISREEARTHKQRNVVYSIIGEKRKLEVGYYEVDMTPGARLLLCSDGLSGMITDEQLLQISQNHADLGRASQIMIEAAKQAGGHDNITAVLVEMN